MTIKHWAILAVSLVTSPLLGSSGTAAKTADWSGIYVGAVGGYGWGEGTHCDQSCTYIGPTVEKRWFRRWSYDGFLITNSRAWCSESRPTTCLVQLMDQPLLGIVPAPSGNFWM